MDACIAGRNGTITLYGFIPFQLVTGTQSSLPFFPPTKEVDNTDDPEGMVYRGYLRDKLQLMQEARMAALNETGGQNIVRAMSKPVGSDCAHLNIGDQVEWYTEEGKR